MCANCDGSNRFQSGHYLHASLLLLLFLGKRGKQYLFFNLTSPSRDCYICKNKGMKPEQEISVSQVNWGETDPAKDV